MALNFPLNPADQAVYIDPVSGLKYIFNQSIGGWETAIQPPVIVTQTSQNPDISIDVTEFIAGTDGLIIPVGGNGYTLDPTGAAKIIKKAEPGVIIPSQYEVKGLSYEVPAQALTEFGKLPNISLEDPQDSYKLSGSSVDDGATQSKVVVLNVKSK